jgi:hypothetical protein
VPGIVRHAGFVLAIVLAFDSFAAAQDAATSRAAARQAVRDRLERAAAGSRELFDRTPPRSSSPFVNLALRTVIGEDEAGLGDGRFSTVRDVREYWRLRPWETAYGWSRTAPVPAVVTEDWPTRSDAAALRELLSDKAADIRGLAVEALGALGLPEDIGSIGALLTDRSTAAPALARTVPQSSMVAGGFVRPGDEDALVPLVWSNRTVGAYARAAVLLMTGHHFDGRGANDVSFPEWIEMHDLGAESLWYWQQRLSRERNAAPALSSLPGEEGFAFRERRSREAEAYQAGLRKRAASDLASLSADAQAKVYLLTVQSDAHSVIGPVNPFFPDGFSLRIRRGRILELLDGRNIWRDVLDEPQAKNVLLWRLARLAPTLLPARDWPRVRKQLQTRATSQAGMPVLVSRLLPAAGTGQADNQQTREGFLRASLARSGWDWRVQLIATEMVRTNLAVQWPFLAARFNEDPEVGRYERLGAVQALAEAPHSLEKLVALVAFLDDPRNAPLLTLPRRLSFDQVRQNAIFALDAMAGTTPPYVPSKLRDDLADEDRSGGALVELRRLGHTLLDRMKAGRR